MRHVEKALNKYGGSPYIEIKNKEDIKGVAPIVCFAIQSDPIKEVGVNGVQAVDMLRYVGYLFESLNEAFPCEENTATLLSIEKAIYWQNERTRNRELRGVEGYNKL